MTTPTAEQMRALACELDGSDFRSVREAGEIIDDAADELERLHRVISDAPHDKSCMRAWEAGRIANMPCNCWKLSAL